MTIQDLEIELADKVKDYLEQEGLYEDSCSDFDEILCEVLESVALGNTLGASKIIKNRLERAS